MTLVPAAVLGVGLWRPGPGAETPPPRLPPQLRRRASLLIKMVAEVAAQATAQAGASLSELPVIVGSAFGELGTTMEILRDIDGEGIVSPTAFQASVHNSAAGYLSIANVNRAASSSIAAGDDTVAMVLLEALTHLTLRGGRVLVIVGDEPLPAALGAGPGAAISAALLLGTVPADAGGRPLVVLEGLVPAADAAPGPVAMDTPCAAILPLLAAIDAGRSARVDLGPPGRPTWVATIRQREGA